MKRDKIFTGLIAWAMSLITALAGIACVVTGFGLDLADWRLILLSCALFAGVAAVCCSFRWGSLVLSGLSVGLLLLFWESLLPSAQHLIYYVSVLFDKAYGWGVLPVWLPVISYTPSPAPALIAMAFPVIAGICWTVCRGKWVGFGPLAGLAPLMLCCVVTDTVPAGWCVALLLGGLMTLTLTQLVRRQDVRSGNRLTAMVLIPVILVSVLLPRFTQQDDYQQQSQVLQDQLLELLDQLNIKLWPGPDSDDPGTSTGNGGPSKSVDLTEVGAMTSRDNPYMYIDVQREDTDSNYNGFFYLRGSSYDTYTGTSWVAQANTAYENGWPYAGLNRVGTIHLTHYMSVYDRFFPYYTLDDNWTGRLVQGAMTDEEPQRSYSFGYYTCSGRAQYTPLNSEENTLYLALPPDTQAAAEQILSQLFEAGADYSDKQKAELIAQYVRNSAAYDLNTEKMPENAEDFALWFLENGETGYCVHFATAATVLLRAAGVPARYVTGYLTYIPDGHVIVTHDQAHAWVEYLDPDCGWAVLEATPGALERVEPEEPTEPPTTEPSEPTELPTTDPTEPPTEEPADPSEESTAPTQETQPSVTTGDPSGGGTAAANLTWLWYVLGILLAWTVLAGQHWLRRRIRRKRLMKGDEKQRALRRWRYVRRAVRILKLPMPEHLQALAEKAVFSQHILTDAELEQFDLWLQQAKRHILTKPWPVRLALWLIYAI